MVCSVFRGILNNSAENKAQLEKKIHSAIMETHTHTSHASQKKAIYPHLGTPKSCVYMGYSRTELEGLFCVGGHGKVFPRRRAISSGRIAISAPCRGGGLGSLTESCILWPAVKYVVPEISLSVPELLSH